MLITNDEWISYLTSMNCVFWISVSFLLIWYLMRCSLVFSSLIADLGEQQVVFDFSHLNNSVISALPTKRKFLLHFIKHIRSNIYDKSRKKRGPFLRRRLKKTRQGCHFYSIDQSLRIKTLQKPLAICFKKCVIRTKKVDQNCFFGCLFLNCV